MLLSLLLVGLIQTCFGGVLYPAATALSSVEAHGPLARSALDYSASTGHLHQFTPATVPLGLTRVSVVPPAADHPPEVQAEVSPVGLTRVAVLPPVAVAPPRVAVTPAPLASLPVAPVDLVHHVPTVAEVPITKYSAQPGFVQRFVDVAKPKVATTKLQIRRPAIQKQFYDIEQRTVVRPIGSAVVELDEPISKKYNTPFNVFPVGHHTLAQYQPPLAYPVGSYPLVSYGPLQYPVQAYPPSFIQQPQFPQIPQQIPQRPQQPAPPAPQPPQQQPLFPQPPQQRPPFPQPTFPSTEDPLSSNEFDSSDTVVVDNPDFGRSTPTKVQQQNANKDGDNAVDFQRQIQSDAYENQQLSDRQQSSDQQVLNEFRRRLLLRQFSTNQGQPVQQPSAPQSPQQPESAQSRSYQELPSSQSDDSNEDLKQETFFNQEDTLFQTLNVEGNQRSQSTIYSNEGQIPSVRNLTPEESQDNQQKLIELLTGRGGVSEIALSRSGVAVSPAGGSGVVRARVLSVTPAPPTAEPEERVSTRRVVVSRPIQTLEEVDIHQPFTKLERVAVHEPALLKTTQTHIARVPASVPVLSRTLAPVLYH